MDWNFIDRSLVYFNIGHTFRRWVSTLYANSVSCVCNNGYSTGFFPVKRGVRQGCPLSPYLFIICAEILSRSILNNNNIGGINVYDKCFKMLQYADDTVILTDGTRESIIELNNTFNVFKLASGLKINYGKTKVFPVGDMIMNPLAFLVILISVLARTLFISLVLVSHIMETIFSD